MSSPDAWTLAERWLGANGLSKIAGTIAHYELERLISAAVVVEREACATWLDEHAKGESSPDKAHVLREKSAQIRKADHMAPTPMVTLPTCSQCNDTHVMASGHMCTSCPTPCEKCRSRLAGTKAGGPFCASTPCHCLCHFGDQVREIAAFVRGEREPETRSGGERVRLHHSLARLRTTLDSITKELDGRRPLGLDDGQALQQTASEVAMQIAKLHAFELAERDAARALASKDGPA